MTFTLRQLEAQLQKVVTITTTEIDQDDGDCKGIRKGKPWTAARRAAQRSREVL